MANDILNTEQTVQSELDNRFLMFYINHMLYSVELRYVLEIITVQSVTHIPSVPGYVKGIINLRGKVIPVIDMRLKLGMEEREYDDKACIVVVEIKEIHIGLIVDSVSEVVNVSKDNTSSTPPGDITEKYISSITVHNDRTVLNIDCEKLFMDDCNMVEEG